MWAIDTNVLTVSWFGMKFIGQTRNGVKVDADFFIYQVLRSPEFSFLDFSGNSDKTCILCDSWLLTPANNYVMIYKVSIDVFCMLCFAVIWLSDL